MQYARLRGQRSGVVPVFKFLSTKWKLVREECLKSLEASQQRSQQMYLWKESLVSDSNDFCGT